MYIILQLKNVKSDMLHCQVLEVYGRLADNPCSRSRNACNPAYIKVKKAGDMVMESGLELLSKYQQMYGKRGSESYGKWITKKRTVNTACYIIDMLSGIDFTEFESALYFRCDDSRMGYFVKVYGNQLEEAALDPGSFVKGLDRFLLDTCVYIEKNNLYRDYFDFFMLLEKQFIINTCGLKNQVFSTYISLLMQQTSYFCRNRTDEQVTSVGSGGSLTFGKQVFPYSDAAAYELEKKLKPGKKTAALSSRDIREAYRMYGYNINSLGQAAFFENIVRLHENNVYFMVPFISNRTSSLILKEALGGNILSCPRQWKKTEVYRERLLNRNYMLPRSGVTGIYKNAGSIKKIIFFETVRFNEVVLLFKVVTDWDGECSGFYWTKNQVFFAGCDRAGEKDRGNPLENFILENYMVLSCDYEIDRKKNFALKQTDLGQIDTEFYYPGQPLVCYSYKNTGSNKNGRRSCRYVKEEYKVELRSRSGYIRRLPEGQCASVEAVQTARELGLDLPEGRTFVRSHDYHVYVKAVKKGETPE